ncbi:RNA-binding protein 28 [Diachasma alloeum]|uniref:RNA-binding protein 28 n=1 Tax=Diachasma alloeum TaxID=454923 RepID=UPI0007384ED7|nr:RNA-binding protein 28 [Diachasma alloeum]
MEKINGPRKDTKKLSWIYKNRKRQRQRKIETNNDANGQVQNKKARIIVRNLSFKVTEDDVRKLYEPFGKIEQIDLLRRLDGKPVGCGFIQFKRIEDASRAIFKTNKKEFLERTLNVSWAIPKAKFVENHNTNFPVKSTDKSLTEEPDIIKLGHGLSNFSGPKELRKERKKPTIDNRKHYKLQKRQKRSRIIIRNLPFTATEEDVKNYFSEYGTIEDIKLLMKSDGKRVGCVFLQYDNVQSAAKAIHYANLRSMMDRLIVVDWAVPKALFQKTDKIEVEEKEHADVSLNEEKDEVKPEGDGLNEGKDEEGEEEENGYLQTEKRLESGIDKRRLRIFDDVNEGKTIFLKNVPFSVKNEELKICMEQFGPVHYALICMDPLTEHSKGTAFVKFRNLKDAKKCLSSGTELQIQGETLDPHRAIAKKDVLNLKLQDSNQTKDSRNLYLVKEGVILPGSPAAVDVSAGDIKKRLHMEQWKSQMLRNLNMFVSRVRLIVHNLPAMLDDAKLRAIFKKHVGKKAVITEAKVMRDLKNPDANGVGISKEFGFVAFRRHDDALRALRSINNNPNIFSKERRPIVGFSIENRIMVNAKQQRAQKSRHNNPLWKGKRSTDSRLEKADGPSVKRFKKIEDKNDRPDGKSEVPEEIFKPVGDERVSKFSGITSRPGDRKMRSKFNLKTQAQLHAKIQKGQKKERKIKRKVMEQEVIETNSRKEIKPKHGVKDLSREEAHLDEMVENYRSKLSEISSKKTKWFETSN